MGNVGTLKHGNVFLCGKGVPSRLSDGQQLKILFGRSRPTLGFTGASRVGPLELAEPRAAKRPVQAVVGPCAILAHNDISSEKLGSILRST